MKRRKPSHTRRRSRKPHKLLRQPLPTPPAAKKWTSTADFDKIKTTRQKTCYKNVIGFSPDSFLWGSLLGKKPGREMPWPRSRSLSAMCPPWPPALARVPPPAFRQCPPGARLVSALCPPSVCFGRASTPFVCHVALWVRHESAPCLLSLSARCSLFICSLSLRLSLFCVRFCPP